MSNQKLINKRYGKEFKKHLFEQYKLYVESADKISVRRDSANNFYLTLNSALFAATGYLSLLEESPLFFVVLPMIGILISTYWMKMIVAYQGLNSGKFKIIHELEGNLPAAIFKYEWDVLGKGKTKSYKPITKIERGIPIIFIILYGLMLFIILIPITLC